MEFYDNKKYQNCGSTKLVKKFDLLLENKNNFNNKCSDNTGVYLIYAQSYSAFRVDSVGKQLNIKVKKTMMNSIFTVQNRVIFTNILKGKK